MKHRKTYSSRSILFVCFLTFIIFAIIIYCFIKNIKVFNYIKVIEDEKNINEIDNEDSLSFDYLIDFDDCLLNSKLENYIKNGYEVSINNINKNLIYGDIHDTTQNGDLFETKNIFVYDIEKDILDIMNFDQGYRLLNYYILNDNIYASRIVEDKIGYKWSILKFNKNLSNEIVLLEGTILDPISTPVFYYSNSNDNLYVISLDEHILLENEIITKRTQDLSIYMIDDGMLSTIKKYNGDYLNKNGTMICSIYDIQIFENDLLLCTTDYKQNQEIKSINLENYDEKVLYSINLNDNWIMTSFQRDKNGIYIGKISMSDSQRGTTSYYSFEDKKTNEIDSEVFYGRTPIVFGNMIFHNLEKWTIYNISNNKFYNVKITGKYSKEYFYPTFYIVGDNKILIKGSNNKFYIGNFIINK